MEVHNLQHQELSQNSTGSYFQDGPQEMVEMNGTLILTETR